MTRWDDRREPLDRQLISESKIKLRSSGSPSEGHYGVHLAVQLEMEAKGPTEASFRLLRKKFDALLEEPVALHRRIVAALLSESSPPFWPDRRRAWEPHHGLERRRSSD